VSRLPRSPVFLFSPRVCKYDRCNLVAAACILPGSSDKVVGNGGTQRVSSTFHQQNKSSGVRPWERSDQDTGILLPIHFGGSFRSKKASTHCNVKMRRLDVASCWNSITLRPLSNRHKEFLQHALVHYKVVVRWVKRERPKHVRSYMAQKHILGSLLVRSISAC